MKFFAFAAVMILASAPLLAQAENVVVFDAIDNDSVVSGTVTRVQGESVFVSSGGKEIEVELDSLDINNVNDFFSPGTNITARGKFSDEGHSPILKAEEAIRSDDRIPAASSAVLLDND